MPQSVVETSTASFATADNTTKTSGVTEAPDDLKETDIIAVDVAEAPPDFPPESFCLSKDAEIEWFDRNAFYERKNSTKGNSKSINSSQHINHSSINSNSQRFSVSLKSKASIFGLPKTQKNAFVDTKRRNCKSASISLFPSRSKLSVKPTGPMTEPSSPKVSCMGRVRSKRGRRGSNPKSIHRSEKPAVEKELTGCCYIFLRIFRSSWNKPNRIGGRRVAEEVKPPMVEAGEIAVRVEPAGLGEVKRFQSGRRSGSWTVEEVVREIS